MNIMDWIGIAFAGFGTIGNVSSSSYKLCNVQL